MNWIFIVGAAVLVAVIGAMFLTGRKNKGETEDDGRMSTSELAEVQRSLWARAEEAISAHKRARGAEVAPARERMFRLADEVDAGVRELASAGASERQVRMAELAAEEIRGFVKDALAAHPEERQA
jgi:hypothetical protein